MINKEQLKSAMTEAIKNKKLLFILNETDGAEYIQVIRDERLIRFANTQINDYDEHEGELVRKDNPRLKITGVGYGDYQELNNTFGW